MVPRLSETDLIFISTMPAGRNDTRLAYSAVLASIVTFVAAAPFAKLPLPQVPAFLPAYQSAVVVSELITAILLLGQYTILGSRPLLVLAGAYLFSAAMAVSHALSFPGLFGPAGFLGAGPQTTAWLYFLWHGGFPLFVLGYALFKNGGEQAVSRNQVFVDVLLLTLAILALSIGLTLLATSGHDALPVIMAGDLDAPGKIVVATTVWAFSVVALAALWQKRPHSILDVWLMVVVCVWIFDSALAAVLNHGRYDLGWYAGRIYGLLAGSFVLMVLLLENGRLYLRLARAHESERRKTADLERLNALINDHNEERRAILENLSDCLVTIDGYGIVRSANPAVERVLGYAAADLVGKNISIIMPKPHRSAHDRYLDNYCRNGVAHVIGSGREVEGLHRNGALVPLDLAVSEYRVNDQRFFIGTLRDISERKRFIAELTQARADAEQANHAKDSFLATMSHEIRTPLTGMLGMLELLSMTRLDDEQAATLDAAWNSGRGLLRIVNDILDWSKIEEGKLQLSLQATSIPNLLQEVINTYSRVASAKNVTLTRHTCGRLSAAHIVDPLRLSQILNNFVSNAIKFTQEGKVEVSAELLEQLDSGERIRFSVKDTGVGIAKEVQEHLFERYRQGEADTARLYGGTGLGLAICRCLADLMDGQIDLASEPGCGATFSLTLTLPIAAQPEDFPVGSHAEVDQRAVTPMFDGSANAPTILAVDDHPINRDLLARQLTQLGLRVEKAENGEAALAKWQDGCFDAIITDCHMPEMDGYGLAKAIRKIEASQAGRHIPIIAWTANAHPDESFKCQSAGMDGLLVKPNNMAQLKGALTTWLSASDANDVPSMPADDVSPKKRSGAINHAALDEIVPDRAAHLEVLLDFQRHLRGDYAKLLQRFDAGDFADIAATAHRMKGSSRMVGAESLANACTALEAAAGKADRGAMNKARIALADSVLVLESYIDGLAASVVDNEGGE